MVEEKINVNRMIRVLMDKRMSPSNRINAAVKISEEITPEHKQFLKDIVEIVKDPEEHPYVRLPLISSLKKFKFEDLEPHLSVLIDLISREKNNSIRVNSAFAFERILEKAEIKKDLKGKIGKTTYQVLEKELEKGKEANAQLVGALASLVGTSGYKGAVPRFRELLKHDDMWVRLGAARALAKLEDFDSTTSIFNLLKLSKNPSEKIRLLTSLEIMGNPSILRKLKSLKDDPDVGSLVEDAMEKIREKAKERIKKLGSEA